LVISAEGYRRVRSHDALGVSSRTAAAAAAAAAACGDRAAHARRQARGEDNFGWVEVGGRTTAWRSGTLLPLIWGLPSRTESDYWAAARRVVTVTVTVTSFGPCYDAVV
jgi:hypothetical protein